MKTYVALFVCAFSLNVAAEQQAPPKSPAQPQAPVRVGFESAIPASEQGGQPTNIRLDVTVIDQTVQGAAQPKSLMVMLVDRAVGRTRAAFQDRSIAVDAQPVVVDGRVRVSLTIHSDAPASFGPPQPSDDFTIRWRNSFSLLLENGKPMLALETMDAVTKRKMSIEVKATIQK